MFRLCLWVILWVCLYLVLMWCIILVLGLFVSICFSFWVVRFELLVIVI